MQAVLSIFKKMMASAVIFSILPALAADIPLASGADLQAAIDNSQDGDRLLLAAGDYQGNIEITRPIQIIGAENGVSRIIGNGKGHVIWVKAEQVELAHLHIHNSGKTLRTMDSGIFLDKIAHHAHIHHNHLENNLFGIYVWGPNQAIVEHNRVNNSNEPRMASRGDGVSLWRSPHSIIRHNRFSGGRDGIATNASKHNLFENNYFRDLRFAVHYMYTEDSEVRDNHAEQVESAYVLMFSNRIRVINNRIKQAKEHGVMLNSVNYAQIIGNEVDDVNKATFIYNANFNDIFYNRFENSLIGIHFTAGSEKNHIANNAFINNRSQAMYVGTREVLWQHEGQGNYWSDHSAFDLNGDGIADTPYKPNNLMDQVLWRAPSAKLLINSPSAQLLKYAQQQFPSLLPGGVSDPYPLMTIPQAPPNHAQH